MTANPTGFIEHVVVGFDVGKLDVTDFLGERLLLGVLLFRWWFLLVFGELLELDGFAFLDLLRGLVTKDCLDD